MVSQVPTGRDALVNVGSLIHEVRLDALAQQHNATICLRPVWPAVVRPQDEALALLNRHEAAIVLAVPRRYNVAEAVGWPGRHVSLGCLGGDCHRTCPAPSPPEQNLYNGVASPGA